jgi:phage-related baseplate assembly protein
VVFPFVQVIVVFLTLTFAGTTGAAAASWLSFTRIVGDEKVKPLADKVNQPSFSRIRVVATLFSPSALTIETTAWIGAFENP